MTKEALSFLEDIAMFGRSCGVFAVLAILGLSAISLGATYGGGSGTAEEPYQIWTAEQMNTIGANSADWDKHFKLMADIDMSAYTGAQYNIIGNGDTKFTGTFDGNEHILQNLTCSHSQDNVGLFGYTNGALIQNLGLENVLITGEGVVGGLVGWQTSSKIISCYVSGQINGNTIVGGLVGLNFSSVILSSYTTCAVNTTDGYAGGLAGENLGTISSCYATGSVSGSLYCIGGLAGTNSGTIVSCYASGSVSGDRGIGGLVGTNSGTIVSCYASGLVIGEAFVGGLTGHNQDTVIACFATSSVDGFFAGGLVGENSGMIASSYAAGLLTGSCVGGLIGRNYGSVSYSFWDVQTSGKTFSDGGIGKTTYQMQTQANFIKAGWDFTDEKTNGLHDFWQMNANDYPRLKFHAWSLSGDGTIMSPYIVANVVDLGKIWLRPFACYQLSCNLDLNEISWSSSVVPVFTGDFDGQRFTISHLTIRRTDNNIGLFGSALGALIQNLSIKDADISGYSYVGGLVGYNSVSEILYCSISGEVSGYSYVGGLSGYNYKGSITNCSATNGISGYSSIGNLVGINENGAITSSCVSGFVGGFSDIGGVVGRNCGAIKTCYATSSIYGFSSLGGLAGENQGTITTCYAAGFIKARTSFSVGGLVGDDLYGTITSSFWDAGISGNTLWGGSDSSSGMSGKTTSEMKTLSTFTDAGWDFIDTWTICEGTNYPRFRWQMSAADWECPDGVNIEDLNFFALRWLMSECGISNEWCNRADSDESGIVDLADFSVFAEQWLEEGYVEPPLPSPAVSWKMDETTGTVVSDSVGGHDGQIVNATGVPWMTGLYNNALKLDGVDDYVNVAGYAGILGTSSRTCMAWIKATANSKEQAILSWGNAASGQKWLFRTQSDCKLAVGVWGGYIYGNVSVADGQWHHVAAVLVDDGSPSVDEIKLYVDGIRQTATYNTTQAIDTAISQNVQIGSVHNGTAQVSFFNGLIDEVRIYDAALTQEQILRVAME
ncbi:MAG: GLUG motif-containing protein [Anaerohalosphaeraceae bacterium]